MMTKVYQIVVLDKWAGKMDTEIKSVLKESNLKIALVGWTGMLALLVSWDVLLSVLQLKLCFTFMPV